jgi:hypothetical protein
MASGVYYIDYMFSIQNGSTLNANPPGGVTIIINGNYPIGVANSTLKITAQATGPFAGIAIFGPRGPPSPVIQEFTGSIQNNIQGAVYFPSQTIQFDSGSQLNSSYCTQIIGDKVHIENNAKINNSCSGTGVTSIPVLEVYLTL